MVLAWNPMRKVVSGGGLTFQCPPCATCIPFGFRGLRGWYPSFLRISAFFSFVSGGGRGGNFSALTSASYICFSHFALCVKMAASANGCAELGMASPGSKGPEQSFEQSSEREELTGKRGKGKGKTETGR